jgi:hypothetical protein
VLRVWKRAVRMVHVVLALALALLAGCAGKITVPEPDSSTDAGDSAFEAEPTLEECFGYANLEEMCNLRPACGPLMATCVYYPGGQRFQYHVMTCEGTSCVDPRLECQRISSTGPCDFFCVEATALEVCWPKKK